MDIRIHLIALLSAFPAWAFANDTGPNPATMAFKDGGTIRMNLSSGTVEVIGTTEEKITVSWRSRSADLERSVKVDLHEQSGGKEAVLAIDGPGNHTQYRIEVPRQSKVTIRE